MTTRVTARSFSPRMQCGPGAMVVVVVEETEWKRGVLRPAPGMNLYQCMILALLGPIDRTPLSNVQASTVVDRCTKSVSLNDFSESLALSL